MELATAVNLIQEGIKGNTEPQTWADLGAGSGLFSLALAETLPPASTIYAIDQQPTAPIRWTHPDTKLVQITSDIRDDLGLPLLDGALMANVLHFLPDQKAFMRKFRKQLTENASMIVVEYNTTRANRWVPYPISPDQIKKLASELGMAARLLGTEPSKFNSGSLYSVLLSPAK
jgi:trans-aconitate methyltransferase